MVRRHWYLVLLLLALAGASVAPAAAAGDPTQAYPSLASPLADLYLEMQRAPGLLAQSAAAHPDLHITADGAVLVWVVQAPGAPARSVDTAALSRLGARVAGMSEHFLEAWVPINMLPRVADEVPGVTFLRPPVEWVQDTYTSEGVAAIGATPYQNAGMNGAGTKVAIVDLSFTGYQQAQAAGEIPADAIIKDLTTTGLDNDSVHGTACAEIVHDMVPEAQLYLVCIDPSLLSSTENAINYCISEGVNVLSWSMGTVTANFLDGAGPICDIMNDAFAQGLLPVVSMGNYAANAGEAHFESVTQDANSDLWVEFSGDDDTLAFNAKASTPVQIWLNWNDWPTTSADYDLYIYDGPTSEVHHWTSTQSGSQPPIEGGTFTAPADGTYYLRVKRRSQSTPTGVRYAIYARGLNGGLEYATAASSLGSPADAVGVVAVGAIDQRWWTLGPQEPYSSQGPTNDGRLKPEVCGPDHVSTYSYLVYNSPHGYFIGTSAATPHVAGAAALIKSLHPDWTPTQVRDELVGQAIDMGAAGLDNVYGAGRVNLPVSHVISVTASADPTLVGSGEATQLGAAAVDSEGHTAFTWSWSDNGAGGTFSPNAAAQNPTWTAPGNTDFDAVPRQLTVTVTCPEASGASASDTITVTEQPVHAIILFPTASPADVPSGGATSLNAHAADNYDHPISYAWTDGGAGGAFSPGPDAADPIYTAPENFALADTTVSLSVTASCDGLDPLSATDGLTITVHPHSDFPDVPYDQWAFPQIEACYREGIVGGYPSGKYEPGVKVTRDQMAVYIARALAGGEALVPTGPAQPSFPDVQADSWAYRYIEYCAGNQIVQGYPDGGYHPAVVVTRDQMAVYIARAIATPTGDEGVADPQSGTQTFTDVPPTIESDTGPVPNWAYKYIEYCAAHGVVQGYHDGTYHPEYAVTRDQMAVYVARAFDLLP